MWMGVAIGDERNGVGLLKVVMVDAIIFPKFVCSHEVR